jgi:hypothetical protein
VANDVVLDKNNVNLPPQHLVSAKLTRGIEEGVKSAGSCFNGLLDLIQFTCVSGLKLDDLDQFKGTMAMTLALGCWS